MRIAYVIDSLGSGGAQRQAVELAATLAERGDIRARFCVYHGEDFFSPRLREAGIEVDRIPKLAKLDPVFPRRLRAWLRRHPADLVHALLLPPSVWSRLAVRGLPRRNRPALLVSKRDSLIAISPAHRLLETFAYRGADAVTANAAAVALGIERELRLPAGRVHYIPNGIDLAAWDRQMLGIPRIEMAPDAFHVAQIGRLVPLKNPHSLLRALTRIPSELRARVRVWLIGRHEPAALTELRREISDRGLSAIVRIESPQREIAAIMGRLGALVLPSSHEGFPNVVLEAMAARKPVIATPVGDVPNLIEEGKTGLMVPVGNDEALAGALLTLLRASEAERLAMGAAARRVVEAKFQLSSIADRYLSLYRSLIST
ncbi:MAG: glycosyltransferase [Myxococcota bacterium]|nr:glycosyltransferase [Myxococcota bacterium]